MRILGPTPERLELARRAADLRARGLTFTAIASRLGVSHSYADALVNDPDGAKARARKDRYSGVCRRCAGPTSGSDGAARAADLCGTCLPLEQHMDRAWTRETVIAAILRWAADHDGLPPLAPEWQKADPLGGYPSTSGVCSTGGRRNPPFSCWADAIEAAGFERPRVGWRRGQRHWSADLVVSEIRRVSTDGMAPPAHGDEPLRKAAERYFGRWSAACEAAGVEALQTGPRREWTPETVAEAIRDRAIDGLPPSSREPDCDALVQAACRCYGSWMAAVRAAGLEPLGHPQTDRARRRRELVRGEA